MVYSASKGLKCKMQPGPVNKIVVACLKLWLLRISVVYFEIIMGKFSAA